jgi:TonB family protein
MSLLPNSGLALTFLLACSAKATILLALAGMITAALHRRSAAWRHQVWTAGIIGALLIPVVALLLPAWHAGTLKQASALLNPSHTAAPNTNLVSLPAMLVDAVASSPAVHIFTKLLFIAWMFGMFAFAARLFLGLVRLRRTSSGTTVFNDQDCVIHSSNSGLTMPVRLLQSAHPGLMPITWGVFRPQILLPEAAKTWTPERRRIVLCHELAHISRNDWAWQICAEVMRALYWFHPLAWIAATKLRHESERACDDCVLNSGVAASDYAAQLLELARTLGNSGRKWAAALAVARPSSFERRLVAMLNPSVNRSGLSPRTKLITAVAALLVLLPLATLRLPAQDLSGKFSGSVHDPSGSGVRNATVIMSNAKTNFIQMTTTNVEGDFTFKSLPAGEYELKVLKRGFEAYHAPQVLESGRESSLNIPLKVGSIMEEVEVVPEGTVKPIPESQSGGKPARLRVGGDIESAKLITKVQPVYPQSAKAAGIQGTVILHAIIGMDGRPLSVRVMNQDADPDLARASVEAVSQWRYEPTLLNGNPIEVDTTIEVSFTLSR